MKISHVIKLLNEYQEKYGNIEVLSPTLSPGHVFPDYRFTDDLNLDCFEETVDWQGNRAVKIYGYS